VPETFWDNFQNKHTKAHRLLKDLGLKHEVSDEEIIQFAKQIESETKGNTLLDVLKERSKLFRHKSLFWKHYPEKGYTFIIEVRSHLKRAMDVSNKPYISQCRGNPGVH